MAKIPYMRDGVMYIIDNEGKEQPVTGMDTHITFNGVDLSKPFTGGEEMPPLPDKIEVTGDHMPYTPEDEPRTLRFTVTYDVNHGLEEVFFWRLKQLASHDFYYDDASESLKEIDNWLAEQGYADIHKDELSMTVTSITNKGRAVLGDI